MPKLTVHLNGHEVLSRELSPGEYVVGRHPQADILLEDPNLLERHARLTVTHEEVVLVDLGPEPTLALEGVVTAEIRPAPGQAVSLGVFELSWQPGQSAGGASAPADAGDRTVVFTPQDGFTDEATVILPGGGEEPKAVLEVREGLAQDTIEVRGRARLGRAEGCEVVLAAGTVSREHAEISVTQDGVTVRDLGSTSGIMVNQERVDQARLRVGDTLRLGEVLLELMEAPGAAGPKGGQAPPPKPQPAPAPPTAEAKPAKAKKRSKRPDKIKAKAKPQAKAKAEGGSRRGLLYGILAVALAVLVVAVIMRSGGDKPQVPQVDQDITQGQQRAEAEQKKRLVVINLTKARQAKSSGQLPEAKQYLQAVLAVDPANQEAKELLDQADADMAEAERLRREAEKKAAEQASQAAELMTQAEAAQAAEDWARVVELGKQILALNPKDGDARALVIEAQAALATAQRMERLAEETAQRRAELSRQLLAQGQAMMKKGQLLAAREELRRAALADPNGPGGAAAAKALAQVEPKIKAQAQAEYKKGAKALKQGKLEQAVKHLRLALAAEPDHAEAAKAMAQAREKAAKLATKLYQEGQVHASLGRMKKACSRWRRATELVASNSELAAKLEAKLAQCKK